MAKIVSRIIPARAGFTASWCRARSIRRDHPRSRGVYMRPWARSEASSGSSPLARGLLETMAEHITATRIIPARAGFTFQIASGSHYRPDHPRSRGVYLYARDDVTVLAGSSPLARGLPHHPGRRLPVPRIIPARAGFTPRGRRVLGRRGDHPRSRGVYQATAPRTLARSGSSPLARGLPMDPDGFRFYTRIIPARAGFTRRSPFS